MNKNILRLLAVAALASTLSGCFLTKVVTTPIAYCGRYRELGGRCSLDCAGRW
jgi:hypothetical protein